MPRLCVGRSMTVVVGAVVWIANSHEPGWRVEKVPFWRDVVGLVIALTAVAAVAADGTVVLWESLSFLGLCAPSRLEPTSPASPPPARYPRARYPVPVIPRLHPPADAPLYCAADVLYVLVVLCLPALLRCFFAGAAAAGAAGLGTRWQQPLLPAGPHAAGPHAQASECARHAAPSALTSAAASAVPPLMMARPDGADPAVRPADEEAEVTTAAVAAVEAAAAAATLEPIELAERPRMGDDEVGRLQRAEWLPPPPVRRTAVSRAGRHPMAGLDWEPGARGCCGLLSTVLWSASLPLAALRWASIPSSDGLWDRRRRLWTLATPPVGALLMLLQVEGSLASAAGARLGGSPLPVAALLLLLGALGSGGLWWATSATAAPRGLSLLVGCGFVQTIAWLNLLAQEMIALIEAAGILLGISTSILGLTVIAFGNSVGDLVADSAAARGADARMAMAACFGSPLLMNILGVGVSLSLRMLVTGGKPVAGVVSQQCRLAYCFLYLALLSHVVTFPCGGFRAPRAYAVYLFALYGVFMLLACLAETGALDLAFLGVGAG